VIITPDDGFAARTVQRSEPSEITIRGARSKLQEITRVLTEQMEVTGVRNNIEVVLKVQRPAGYGITIDPDTVRVNIEIVPVKTRLFEKIPIIVYNSPSGKRVRPMPLTIDIEMTGPPDEINLLNRNALIASVDFGKLSASDSAPIKIDCPNHFKVKSTSAQFVKLATN
jgi:YbbR domain-containing protein